MMFGFLFFGSVFCFVSFDMLFFVVTCGDDFVSTSFISRIKFIMFDILSL